MRERRPKPPHSGMKAPVLKSKNSEQQSNHGNITHDLELEHLKVLHAKDLEIAKLKKDLEHSQADSQKYQQKVKKYKEEIKTLTRKLYKLEVENGMLKRQPQDANKLQSDECVSSNALFSGRNSQLQADLTLSQTSDKSPGLNE